MKKSEIRQQLNILSQTVNHSSFIYDFLSCFGLSKTTIARLRKGDYNLSDTLQLDILINNYILECKQSEQNKLRPFRITTV